MMGIPLVPDQPLSEIDQFVTNCIANGGQAEQAGARRCFQQDKLHQLQYLLRYLRVAPTTYPQASTFAHCPPGDPSSSTCTSHALEEVTIDTYDSASSTMVSPSARAGSTELVDIGVTGELASLSRDDDSPAVPALLRINPGRSCSHSAANAVQVSIANKLRNFDPLLDCTFRNSALMGMPNRDDTIFSSFVDTLDLVLPAELPSSSSRALYANGTIRSHASSTTSWRSVTACMSQLSSRHVSSPSAIHQSWSRNELTRCIEESPTRVPQSVPNLPVQPSAKSHEQMPKIVVPAHGWHHGQHKSTSTRSRSMGMLSGWGTLLAQTCSNVGTFPTVRESADRKLVSNDPTHAVIWAEVLNGMGSWVDFDVSEIARRTRAPLLVISFAAFTVLGLLDTLNISKDLLIQFLELIEALYPRCNPYHNSTHAADVVQALTCMLLSDNLSKRLTDLEVLAMLIAAIVHDVGHPGVTNQFLRSSRDDLSYLFSNKSVAENASLAIGLGLLANDRCNFLRNMDLRSMDTVESLIVVLVLNTDMMFHCTILAEVDSYAASHPGSTSSAGSSDDPHGSVLNNLAMNKQERWGCQEFRTAAMSLLIHAADINSVGRRPEVAGMWASAIYAEFFRQGELELEQQLPPTPFFQRDKVVIWHAQIEFAKTFVTPIYDAVQSIAPEIGKKVLSQISRNVDLWGALGASGPPPLAVLRGSHSSAPKELHVHCGEAVCKDGTSQPAILPLLLVYSNGITAFLDDHLTPWTSLAQLPSRRRPSLYEPGQQDQHDTTA